VSPLKKEKHFVVCDVEYDERGEVQTCVIEAIMSKRQQPIQWRDLQNLEVWQQGWK
jgi:tryptophan-rich hypothetical protein